MKTLQLNILLVAQLVPGIGRADPLDTWTFRRGSPTQIPLYSVAYGNGMFVAVGDGIIISPDGVTWALRHSDASASLAAGVSRFVYGPTGSFQTNFIMTSADLINWSEPSALLSDAHFDSFGLSFAGDAFFANARDVNGGHISYSTNGVTWSPATGIFWGYLGRPVYRDGQFVALGGVQATTTPPYAYESLVVTSADGLSWGRVDLGTQDSLGPLAYGNGQFVALGGYGTNWVSADGVNWTRLLSETGASLDAIAFGGVQFVAVGDGVLTSPDGANWSQRESNQDFHLRDVTYGAGQFVAVGTSGSILTSPDGINWKRRSSGTNRSFSGVVYGGGHFVAIGDYGAILKSDNLLMLDVISGITNGELRVSLTGLPGLACTIQSSADLISWRNLTNITTSQAGTATFDAQARVSNAEFYRAYSQ